MAENSDFLVGITPDWTDWMDRMLGTGLGQVFGDLPDIKHELMPANANKALTAEVLRRYDAVIVFGYKVRRESLEGVEKLLCVSRYGVGFDTVDIEACNDANVLVSITPEGVQRSVAEGTIALMFSIAKNLRNYDIWVREGTWSRKLSRAGVNVQGRTLGAVGLGNIASEVMRLAKGVGFGRLIGADPYVSKESAAELGVELVDLPTVMRESDFRQPAHAAELQNPRVDWRRRVGSYEALCLFDQHLPRTRRERSRPNRCAPATPYCGRGPRRPGTRTSR